MEKAVVYLLILIYINKPENRITFKIRLRYSFEFLTLTTMKLSENTEGKITKDKNGENMRHSKTRIQIKVYRNTKFIHKI